MSSTDLPKLEEVAERHLPGPRQRVANGLAVTCGSCGRLSGRLTEHGDYVSGACFTTDCPGLAVGAGKTEDEWLASWTPSSPARPPTRPPRPRTRPPVE